MAPAAFGEVGEAQGADADALQVHDLEPDQVAHPADLAVAAFLEDEAQLLALHDGGGGLWGDIGCGSRAAGRQQRAGQNSEGAEAMEWKFSSLVEPSIPATK